MLAMPYYLALKSEALHFAGRTAEALQAIKEAEAAAERSEQLWWNAELHRLRAVYLGRLGAEDARIHEAFREAIRAAMQQKSVSLATRAEASYAEYRRQRA